MLSTKSRFLPSVGMTSPEERSIDSISPPNFDVIPRSEATRNLLFADTVTAACIKQTVGLPKEKSGLSRGRFQCSPKEARR
jgi:hypothetical protein